MKSLLLIVLIALPSWSYGQRRDDVRHMSGGFNWKFLRTYPQAARLFNAFDYGHAVLYERLWTEPDAPPARLEEKEFGFLTGDLLRRPPKFAVPDDAVMPSYSRLVPRAHQMFDWAHELHRQIYDVYSDARIPMARKDSLIERITDYYLSNRTLAFTVQPKQMSLMDDAYYSQVFRRAYPKFNGLIWAYHWLQVGLYEPMIAADSAAMAASVAVTVARFWAMVDQARFPGMMPMTPAIAPRFTARHPRAAAIFDNLHMMHDIISDILVSDRVPRGEKARVIAAALDEFRDGSRNTMTREEWQEMADAMGGAGAMGGAAWTPPPGVP